MPNRWNIPESLEREVIARDSDLDKLMDELAKGRAMDKILRA